VRCDEEIFTGRSIKERIVDCRQQSGFLGATVPKSIGAQKLVGDDKEAAARESVSK
jgi:hypothetical protein